MATASRWTKIFTVSSFAFSPQLLADCPGHVLYAPQPIVDGWLGILPHAMDRGNAKLRGEAQQRSHICT
jgi:hypothetical protein